MTLARSTLAVVAALAVQPASAAAADYTWTGGGPGGSGWSTPANWSGGVAPANGETIGTLNFPALTDPACAPSTGVQACGRSVNDLTGVTIGHLVIDDSIGVGAQYDISGNPITLTGGLTASPGGSGIGPVDFISTPIALGAPQTWTVAGNGPLNISGGLSLGAPVTGPGEALTIDVSGSSTLLLTGDNEVGPLTIAGVPGNGQFGGSGVVVLASGSPLIPRGRLNAADGNSVTVTNATLAGDGDVGPLTVSAGLLEVSRSQSRTDGRLVPAGLTLDSASRVELEVNGSGSSPGADYTQLASTGPVALGGAQLTVAAGSGDAGATCPQPALGTVYALITTTGSLTGTLAVPPGGVADVATIEPACQPPPPFAVQIAYQETGSPQTVTATVVPAPPPGVTPGVAGAARVSGTVLIRRPGRRGFSPLRKSALIPSGSELDTTRGRVRVFAATDRHGGTTTAEVYAGRVVLRQPNSAHPRTHFRLSAPLTCRARGATAASAHRKRRRRHVWVSEQGGRFDTRAQYVSTSVQGTKWLTEDTCGASSVRVAQGRVTVRDLVHHRTVRLRAGQRLTVRRRR